MYPAPRLLSLGRRQIFHAALACSVALASIPGAILRGAETAEICAGKDALGLPEWMRNATVYEINVRQFSPAGNFAGVETDLPRLRDLGVTVLWFMPIHPVGEVNRKGTLGSAYSVQNYDAVNPEFGTAEDFKKLVAAAHAAGFRVVLDWVGNHTAWDNPLTKSHPEFYMRDAAGKFIPPIGFDWTDVIQLDFKNPAVLDYEAESMTRWVRDFGVDGFRCDYATGLPTDFWNKLAARLREAKPDIFMLAESELPQQQLHAFNASYAWTMLHALEDVAQGHACVSHIDDVLARESVQFPRGAAMLRFTTNHDENSWSGTVTERFGGGARVFAALTFALDGVPLIYNGEEAGLDRRLEFFEHDPIDWRPSPMTSFYHTLCVLKKTNPAMRFGSSTARRIATTKNESIYALLRETTSTATMSNVTTSTDSASAGIASGKKSPARLVCFFNLTAKDAKFDAADASLSGKWRDVFTNENVTWTNVVSLEMRAWTWRVMTAAE